MDFHFFHKLDIDFIGDLPKFIDCIGVEGVFAAGQIGIVHASIVIGNQMVVRIDTIHLVIDRIAFVGSEAENGDVNRYTIYIFSNKIRID